MAELRGSRVLVTGGAGMIGSTIVDQLVALDVEEVVVVDNLARGLIGNLDWACAHGSVRVIRGDIRDRRVVDSAMRGVDLVFHQAAIRITQCAEEPRLALEVLVDGTFNVVEAAARARVSRLVAASSASVYGGADEFPTDEHHHPWNNRTLYGAAKAFNEGMLRSFEDTHGLDWVALRYFNVYGPRMDAHGVYTEVLIRWMERIAAGRRPVIFGDGLQTMDFVYVGDVAAANISAACAEDTGDRVFNIARGQETTLLQLVEALVRAMGARPGVEHGPPRATNGVRRRLADVRAAKQILGFTARVGIDEGLERLVAWWRAETERGRQESQAAVQLTADSVRDATPGLPLAPAGLLG